MNEDDPTLLGRCANQLSRLEFCLRKVYSTDDEAVEIAPRQFICGVCVDRLLRPTTEIAEPEDKRLVKHSNPNKASRRSARGSFRKIVTVAA